MKLINELLKKIYEKYTLKDFLIFFIIILIPNLLRQIVYFITASQTGSIAFIESLETKEFFAQGLFKLGYLQEIIIATIYSFLWFNFARLKFLSYAWLFDAFIDFLSVLIWLLTGFTPLALLGLNTFAKFFIREIFLPYIIFGPLLYLAKINIKLISIIVSLFGLITILILFL